MIKLKRLLKKYKKICNRGSKIHEQIMGLYEDTDSIGDGMKYTE